MTLGSTDTGDIVKVDKRGSRFYAMVVQRRGRIIDFLPLDQRISERTCTSHEVVGIWKATKATLDAAYAAARVAA